MLSAARCLVVCDGKLSYSLPRLCSCFLKTFKERWIIQDCEMHFCTLCKKMSRWPSLPGPNGRLPGAAQGEWAGHLSSMQAYFEWYIRVFWKVWQGLVHKNDKPRQMQCLISRLHVLLIKLVLRECTYVEHTAQGRHFNSPDVHDKAV